jgi:hypothetical protein
MKTTERDSHPTDTEIAVRALAIWKQGWFSQEFRVEHLLQAREELENERRWECDEEAAVA